MHEESLEVSDLASPDTFSDGVPHPFLTRLRHENPVALALDSDARRWWAVTRHADILAVSRDTTTFSSVLDRSGEIADGRPGPDGVLLLNMDPPVHAQYRRTVAWRFSPKALAAIEEFIGQRAAMLVAEAVTKRDVDFATEVAARLPLAVIADLLGIEPDDHDLVLGWSNRLVGAEDAEFGGPESLASAQADSFSYFSRMAAQRRRSPGEDLVSLIATSDVAGGLLPIEELASFCLLLLIGGSETTRNTIAHTAVMLAEHPDAWRLLAGNPSLVGSAVEEFLRYSTAFMQSRRVATRDAMIGDTKVMAGDAIALWYASANRDGDVFDAPQQLDLTRQTNPHFTFGGGGPHVCLGAHLARLEIGAIVRSLIDQVEAIEVIAPPVRLRSSSVNGIKHLSVRLSPRPQR